MIKQTSFGVVLIVLIGYSDALASCPTNIPVFDPNNPNTFPPNGALQMCIGGSTGTVACDQQVVRDSNLGKTRLQKILIDRARRNAKGAFIEHVEVGDWITSDTGIERVFQSNDGQSDSEEYESVVQRSLILKTKMKAGVQQVAQVVNDKIISVCVGYSLQSNSIANTLAKSDTNNETRHSNSDSNSNSADDAGLNSNWVAPIPKK